MKTLVLLIGLLTAVAVHAADMPMYKPSSRSPAAIDIMSNEYGYSSAAPSALAIGETAPDFTLPGPFDAQISLDEATRRGPAVLIFYRGHW